MQKACMGAFDHCSSWMQLTLLTKHFWRGTDVISQVTRVTYRRECHDTSSLNGTQSSCRLGTQISVACILRGAKPDLRG